MYILIDKISIEMHKQPLAFTNLSKTPNNHRNQHKTGSPDRGTTPHHNSKPAIQQQIVPPQFKLL